MMSNYRVILNQCLITARFELPKRAVLSARNLSLITSENLCRSSIKSRQFKLQHHVISGKQNLPRGPSRSRRCLSSLRPFVDPNVSYAFGRSTSHLEYSTIMHEFDKKLKKCPDEIAYVSYAENKEVSFRQLNQDINKLVKGMIQKLNIVKGDFVGIFGYNCFNWLVIQLACARVGAVLSPINPSNKSEELAFVLRKGKVKCLFLPGPKSAQAELNQHLDVLQTTMSKPGDLYLKNVVFMDEDNLYDITSDGDNSYLTTGSKLHNCNTHNWQCITDNDGIIFKSLSEAEDNNVSEDNACILCPNSISPDDLFAVYYTSGTTGDPKGACVSHFTALNNSRFCQMHVRAGRPDSWKSIINIVLPMFHIFAGVLINFSPITSNAMVIYSSYKYVVKDFVDSIYKYQGNVTALTPTMLIDMLSYVEAQKLNDIPLKIIQSGGAYISPETVTKAYKTLTNLEEVRIGYGSTENGSVATMQNFYEPSETRSYTVGSPLDFTEIRIVKPNTDEAVPIGEKGEIQTRGFNTMMGYLDEPEKTTEVLTLSKWYKTGDMGLMHPHGSIQISGRLKQMIIKGGENIYPEEVSNLIKRLEYVENAHVVGVPDKRFGEQVCAWIKLRAGYKEAKGERSQGVNNEIHKDDIIRFCKENITYFKVPKYVLFVDDFPMTPTKKIQSHLLTATSIKILGLEDQVA